MTRDNKPESPTEKRIEYAYWAIPGQVATVTYSLPLFHEIDFAVNEGYRKIPHGGIEEGGLLFGKIDEKGVRVDAFRSITCEHASGPSFLLSNRDLLELDNQIAAAPADPELAELDLIGWFLAHTRGPLALTDREIGLCNRYFAKPGMLTVLAKPERFQPTRFGFLVRGADGSLARDAAPNAVILPLPGRNTKVAPAPIASIPAPAMNIAPARRPPEPQPEPELTKEPIAQEIPPVVAEPKAEEKPKLQSVAEPEPQPSNLNRSSRRQRRFNIDRAFPKKDDDQEAAPEKEKKDEVVPPVAAAAASESKPEAPAPPPPQIRKRSSEISPAARSLASSSPTQRSSKAVVLPSEPQEIPDPYRQFELLNQKRPPSTAARMVMVLPLAALLGCLVGWLASLQIPSPIIPLTVKNEGPNLVVSWPAEQTRNAVYAAVRLDDGTPEMLTTEEKNAGRVKIEASTERKVELIARNWIHDSRGIVHYVKPVANTAP